VSAAWHRQLIDTQEPQEPQEPPAAYRHRCATGSTVDRIACERGECSSPVDERKEGRKGKGGNKKSRTAAAAPVHTHTRPRPTGRRESGEQCITHLSVFILFVVSFLGRSAPGGRLTVFGTALEQSPLWIRFGVVWCGAR